MSLLIILIDRQVWNIVKELFFLQKKPIIAWNDSHFFKWTIFMDIFASGSLILIFFSDWMDTGLTYVRVRIVNVLLVSYVRPMLYYLSRFEFDFDFRQSWFLTLIHEFLWIEKKKIVNWMIHFFQNEWWIELTHCFLE